MNKFIEWLGVVLLGTFLGVMLAYGPGWILKMLVKLIKHLLDDALFVACLFMIFLGFFGKQIFQAIFGGF